MNYHAKIVDSSLKIDWLILNLIFGGHFFYSLKMWDDCRRSRSISMQNFMFLAWKLTELCSILFFCNHFVFLRPFFFASIKKLGWLMMMMEEKLTSITCRAAVRLAPANNILIPYLLVHCPGHAAQWVPAAYGLCRRWPKFPLKIYKHHGKIREFFLWSMFIREGGH